MTTRVAIVGCRYFNDYDLLYSNMGNLFPAMLSDDPQYVIVSGGAPGADTLAARFAKEEFMNTEIFRADWEKHGKAAGPLRNQKIVDRADYVVAFWDGKSRGTKDTINKTMKAKKPLIIIPIRDD